MKHEHDYYYYAQFSWGGYWECACGYRPTEAEWNEWFEWRPDAKDLC